MCATAANAARYRNFQVIADILKLLSRSGLSRNNSAAISALLDELSAMEKSKTSQGTDSTIPSTVFAVTPAAAAGLTSGTITNESSPEESSNEAVLDEDLTLQLADEISNHVLHTIYLGTENSSFNTKDRARRLAGSIQSYHSTIIIDDIVRAVLKVFSTFSGGKMPRYESQGGTPAEDLALQNIQARLRMVMSYLCAQLFPWLRGNKGFLLVLGSANVDEALRGYMTKYDCSSADINPIGGMSKGDLKRMMLWVAENYQLPVLSEVALAAPTVSY